MATTSNPPSIRAQAFDCPHCGAYTTQYWFDILSDQRNENAPPNIPGSDIREFLANESTLSDEAKQKHLDWCDKMDMGFVFFIERKTKYPTYSADNIHFSKCYHCKKIAVWIHGNLLFPSEKSGIAPNSDLPDDVIRDFEEARAVLNDSPRGAAALLRLCVQKLCIHLGEKGKSIDDDIASLVAKGLNPLVQKSLDIVRVVGNEAVHPGVMDLNDDRDTASQLLYLVNSIADQMISHPKQVELMYEKLPEGKRAAIEQRDDDPKS